MGKTGTTRAGYEGSINTTTLQTTGFGVFGYYTGTDDYTAYQYSNGSNVGKNAANFMFNQKVVYTNTPGYVSKWTYSPLKYWPNDISTSDVDDQDNNSNSLPASGSEAGGKLSFFAYAPHVEFPISETTDGIVAINAETALASANAKVGDPIITYILPNDGKTIDLLWGTYNGTSKNVNITGNAGVTGTNAWNGTNKHYTKIETDYQATYPANLLNGFTTNADLTKQQTNGTVGFLFKHALAKIGGSENPGAKGASGTNGLMAILDLDNMKGAETGGTKDNSTIVTIESITIQQNEVAYDTNDDGTRDGTGYVTGAKFNLATGQWYDYTTGAAAPKYVITSPAYGGSDGTATLATSIAEPSTFAFHTSGSPKVSDGYFGSEAANTGVTTSAKNVFNAESNPFVFIPGTVPSFNITVAYYVRTYDSNLPNSASGGEGTWSKVKQTITKKITFADPVELNKQYNLLMHIGLTGIKFTATVSDWELATGTNNADTNNDQTVDIYAEEVHLPINVSPFVFSTTMDPDETAIVKEGGTRTISGHMTYYPADQITTTTEAVAAADITWNSDRPFATVTDGVVSFSANTTPVSRNVDISATYNGSAFEKANVSPITITKTFTQAAYPVTADKAQIDFTIGTSANIVVTYNTNAAIDLSTYNASITSGSLPTGVTMSGNTSDTSGQITFTYDGASVASGDNHITITIGDSNVNLNIHF